MRQLALIDECKDELLTLHVARTGSFRSGGRDVLADVGGWHDNLTLADIVVFDKDDLEEIANVRIIVYNFTNFVHKVNDCLRHPVKMSKQVLQFDLIQAYQ